MKSFIRDIKKLKKKVQKEGLKQVILFKSVEEKNEQTHKQDTSNCNSQRN